MKTTILSLITLFAANAVSAASSAEMHRIICQSKGMMAKLAYEVRVDYALPMSEAFDLLTKPHYTDEQLATWNEVISKAYLWPLGYDLESNDRTKQALMDEVQAICLARYSQ